MKLFSDYGLKMGNDNSSADDLIVLQCTVLIIDNTISNNGSSFSLKTLTNFNYQTYLFPTTTSMTILRSGLEQPVLVLNANFLTNIFTQGYILSKLIKIP